ncbi:MAG: ABC transporter permease [Candidatus Korarchaeota archaeon]|nr:ABC transporter permease [Candidatus Korarchaeota archaeon]NIU85024.1 ABC transporter permease subunit [Candidatus Thorarchaeota archaeon]NIW15049.1 ABC transporter permease subunit [Candidatus Thorarchaeota archaeon]NIW53059.1 ABC transporter permease subunit [Candidatus Korarchaeota archaeon]
MNKIPSPKSKSSQKYATPGFKALIDKSKQFLNEFKRERIGLAGVAILLLVGTLGFIGNVFGDPDDTLYRGDGSPAAAPGWVAYFDEQSFKDQLMITQDFNEVTDLSTLENDGFIFQKSEISNGTYLNANYSLNQGHLNFIFTDTGISSEDSSFSASPQATLVITKNIDWDFEKSPNNHKFHYFYKFDFSGCPYRHFSRPNVAYNFSFTTYIKARDISANGMRHILDENGVIIPEESFDSKYGMVWAKSVPMLNTTHWTKKKSTISIAPMLAIFEIFSKLELNFVAEFNIVNPQKRSEGTFIFSIDDLEYTAHGYYEGIMGTTPMGADLFTLITKGMKNDFILGLSSTAVTLFLGITLGLMAGYFGGKIDESIMRVVDFLLILPGLPIMLILVIIFQESNIPTVWAVIMSIAFIRWGGLSRSVRSQVLSERERPYVEAAKACGAPPFRIMFGHIFPNIIGLIIYQVVLYLQTAILITAGLSFFGMGPDWISFGRLIQQVTAITFGGGQSQQQAAALQQGGMLSVWWFVLFPGMILTIFGTGLVFVGMAIQRVMSGRGKLSA